MFEVTEKASSMIKNFLEKQTASLKKGFFATLFGRGDGYCHIHSAPKEQENARPKDKQEADKDPQNNLFYIRH
jgi:hypothetical protein